MYIANLNRKHFLIIFTLLTILLYVLNVREVFTFSSIKERHRYSKHSYLINTTGCRIPFLEVYAEEVMQLMGKARPYNCGRPPLVKSNLTALFVDTNVFKDYGIDNYTQVNCNYKPFWRVDPVGNDADDKIQYGDIKYFPSSINVSEEFTRVECSYRAQKYVDFHSFVPMKKTQVDTKRAKQDEKLNVIILGTDSLSRLQFHRKMPKTVKYLLDELHAIEFMGYNKLADNTFPNLMPMLTGNNVDELKKLCWFYQKMKFDNCSFIWKNFSNAGYVTSFSEEKTVYGLFNFFRKGWFKQPTDYYWKSFDSTAMNEIGHYYDFANNYPACMSSRPMYKVLLNYIEKYVETLKNNHFFILSWITSLTHDDYDSPSVAEDDYIQHMKTLKDSGALNNSILILLSDHGYRYGYMPRINQGHLEERLPMLYFVLPPWFQKRYSIAMDNIKKNSFRLVTAYDIHATLNHLLHPNKLIDDQIRNVSVPNKRSISLFLPIPLERTCENAEIAPHWCTCHASIPVNKTNAIVVDSVKYAVQYMNYLLSNFTDCSVLELGEITDAKLAKYGDLEHKATTDYSVTFKTNPGGGWFDTTVRCSTCEKNDFRITGSISRLNRYNNTSHCIDDLNLKLYCYCKQQLSSN